jgi:translation initiation factor IF-3
MRPRRGPDTRPQEPKTRVNEAIRVPRVRLIDVEGEQVGLKTRDEALEYAWGKNLDLVEVAPDANPPVCRVMDYSKYKYEQEQKQKLARKHQSTITIKEIKLRPKIDPHDYETKKGHVLRFLRSRDKVKVTIMFRGREMYHPERGRSLLLRLAEDVKDLAMIESDPLQDGRNMVMMLAPHKEAVVVKPASEAGDEEGQGPSAAAESSKPGPSETAPEALETPEAPETPEAETPEAETAEAETPKAETPEAETAEAETPKAASPEPAGEPAPAAEAEAHAETPVTPA